MAPSSCRCRRHRHHHPNHLAPTAPPAFHRYGTASEPLALVCYQAQTGQSVDLLGFKLWGEDPAHSWLGVSPDGLVQGAQASELLPGGWGGLGWGGWLGGAGRGAAGTAA